MKDLEYEEEFTKDNWNIGVGKIDMIDKLDVINSIDKNYKTENYFQSIT